MPKRDGTGPNGDGAKTGNEWGKCDADGIKKIKPGGRFGKDWAEPKK